MKRLFISFALFAVMFTSLASAQQATGSMIGTITDPSGGGVPGAEVTVRNHGTAATFIAQTDSAGVWQVDPGVYDVNRVSAALIALTPPPEAPGSPNFIRSVSNPLDNDSFVGRVDWTLSSKDTLCTHITYLSQWTTTLCLFGLPLCGGSGAGGINNAENRQDTAGWTCVFSPSTINQFQPGYVRRGQFPDLLDSNLGYNLDWAESKFVKEVP